MEMTQPIRRDVAGNVSTEDIDLLPQSSHPNFRLWANYARFAHDRGEMVADIIEMQQPLHDLKILDAGFGMGGTSATLVSRGATVVALEFNPQKVMRLKNGALATNRLTVLLGDAQQLNFPEATFDWVIFQDVLEHLPHPEKAIANARRILKPDGRLYISTPNRWSLLNLISDPHWNLPLVGTLPRKGVEFFITKLTRREATRRADFAALFSLRKLSQWLKQNQFCVHFVNKTVAYRLFTNPPAVVNSDLHIRVVELANRIRFAKALCALVNDRRGFFNHLINPTLYLIAQKTT